MESVTADAPSGDLTMVFSTGTRLLIFCDCMQKEEGDNYTFFTPLGAWTVGPRGGVVYEAGDAAG